MRTLKMKEHVHAHVVVNERHDTHITILASDSTLAAPSDVTQPPFIDPLRNYSLYFDLSRIQDGTTMCHVRKLAKM